MATTLYAPKSEDIPSIQRINKMSLEELNIEIYRLSSRANTRLYRLENKTPESATILQAKKLAAEWNPSQKQGLANRFRRTPAKTVQEARSRLSNITKFLKWESSTISGQKEIQKKRISSMEQVIGKPLTKNEFDDIVEVLERTRDISGVDSNQIINIMKQELSQNKFENVDDLVQFIESASGTGKIIEKEYDDIEADFIMKYNDKTGKFEKVERDFYE